jgi:UTP--glucose-1-phosphate uridylyltransferase
MKIKKAVITAAGRGVRLYPVADTVQKAMLPLIDQDGLTKPAIQIIAEEAFDSGIEEICVVCAPGDEKRYLENFRMLRDNLLQAYRDIDWARSQADKIDQLLSRLSFTLQEQTLGYGHAVHCAKDFVADQPFLLLLGDHLYVSDQLGKTCASQIIDLATRENCAVSAVNPTPEHEINKYGTLTGKALLNHQGVYEVDRIIEKPSVSIAELELLTPGLRTGYYLCFFGMHVLTPAIFSVLEEHQFKSQELGYLLTPALQELSEKDKYLALEVKGRRFDLGKKFGLLEAQLALGVAGQEKDRILTRLVNTLAEAGKSGLAS